MGQRLSGNAARVGVALAAGALAAAGLGGCSGSSAGGSGQPASPASPVASDAAGGVALKYATALFSPSPGRARAYVDPASRQAFRLVVSGTAGARMRARGLRVGETRLDGDVAVTTLLGRLCKTTPGAAPQCVANDDPASPNPIFKIATQQQPDGTWLVTLATPVGR
ncbi:MAG: hypothetical protein R2731_17850 [Nocardioides sp.]